MQKKASQRLVKEYLIRRKLDRRRAALGLAVRKLMCKGDVRIASTSLHHDSNFCGGLALRNMTYAERETYMGFPLATYKKG